MIIKYWQILFLSIALFSQYVNAEPTASVAISAPIITNSAATIELTGSIRSEKFARLSPLIDGLVTTVRVDAGQPVNQGDVLLELDSTLASIEQTAAKAVALQAKTALAEAERQLAEHIRLSNQHHVSASEVAARQSTVALTQAAYNAALAQAELASELLKRHTLKAPFNGVISKKLTESGEWVNRSNTVLELVSLDPLQVDVMVPQERFNDFAIHSQAIVLPDALPNIRLNGEVIAKVPVSDTSARAFLVRILIHSNQPTPLPGTSAKVILHSDNGDQRLIISKDALLRHPDGKTSVFIINDNIAQRLFIEIGRERSDGIEVISGIDPDMRIVVRGNEVLRDGQTVQISPTQP